MAALLYRCPTTGLPVQRWFANEVPEASMGDQYETVVCPACALVHLVNPTTGKVLAADDK
jgi:hypothetical protein